MTDNTQRSRQFAARMKNRRPAAGELTTPIPNEDEQRAKADRIVAALDEAESEIESLSGAPVAAEDGKFSDALNLAAISGRFSPDDLPLDDAIRVPPSNQVGEVLFVSVHRRSAALAT